MNSQPANPEPAMDERLTRSRWRHVPLVLVAIGVIAGAATFLVGDGALKRQFAYSYLLAFTFYLSIGLGALFLVLIHHLCDAASSTPLRRVAEHVACSLPWMGLLFVPIAVMALLGGQKLDFYPWMQMNPASEPSLRVKEVLLNKTAWLVGSAATFAIWSFLTMRLRSWSLRQDETGSAKCTYKMRFHSCWGIVAFAFTVTLAIILWVKSLEHEWFSTMYGVYYFAESVWTGLAVLYLLVVVLKNAGPLSLVITRRQIHDLNTLWFAFTVFYAYIHFSQYFIIWNANIPEETWHYLMRENGVWWQVGMLIVFGHFLLPFLMQLRIDWKVNPVTAIPLAVWALLMHFCDVSFNIMPVLHPEGSIAVHPLDIACLALIGGVLALVFLRDFAAHPAFPQKDPRLGEALGLHFPQPTELTGVQPGKQP